MNFHNFKPYAYGFFLILIISLAGTAYADPNQLVCFNGSINPGDITGGNSVYKNNSSNNGSTTSIQQTVQAATDFNGQETENIIVDNSGHGNNGINTGSTVFTLPNGQIARHFNGENKITIPNNERISFTDPNITFGVFFRYNSSNPTYTYLASNGNNSFKIIIDHNTSTISYKFYADGQAVYNQSESYIQPDKDYEAIVTYDGHHAQLYINGVPDGNGVNYTAASLDQGDNAPWTVGSSSDNTYGLDGTIYAFYLYDRALSSSEIFKLYTSDVRDIKKLDNRGWGVAISWDDSAHIESCYQYLDIFEKYNATSTINVNRLDTRSQTVKDQLKGLHDAGWEVACHGYNHMNSRLFLVNSNPTTWLNQEIFPNIEEIESYGYPVYTLAYPFSDRNPTTDAILAPYFRTLRTRTPEVINGHVNETPKAYYKWDDAQLLYGVEIDDHSLGGDLESVERGIDLAKETGTVLILYGHLITPTVGGSYQTSTTKLDAILNYVSSNGGTFYHMGDLGNSSTVNPYPIPNFTVSNNSILVNESVIFVDYSTNQKTEVLDFGDSSPTSSTANVTHVYTSPGVYTAKLTVTNDAGSDSMSQTITVTQPQTPTNPVANFTSNSTTGPRPLVVAFTDTSSGFPVSWSWNFGDGSPVSQDRNPLHTYSAVGNYTVDLTVSNANGTDSKLATIVVSENPFLPVANFIANPTSGYVPLTVQFTDSTQNADSRTWDFGDGTSSTEQSPAHVYSAEGTYNVKLEVGNSYGNSSKTGTITVQKESHHSSGSSGGGSAGGSPEPQSNVEVKELSQTFVSSGKSVKFDFPRNATPVVSISLDSKKTAGKTTTIAEMLKGKSTLVTGLPSDEVYKYLNIWVGNSGFATPSNIENAVVNFKVDKSWIQDKKIDSSSITLNRYSDKKWNLLPASLSSEDGKYLYFTAKTPGFSPFAITGKSTATGTVIQPADGNKTQPVLNNTQNKSTDETKDNSSTPAKESKSMPGFEIVCGITGLLTVFLYIRKTK